MFKQLFYTLLALLLALPAQAKVSVEQGYVRLLPPGTPNTAAFMTLNNEADKPVRLVAAASSAAARVELHTHLNDNGVMRMRQVAHIEVPAGGHVQLQPGGLHVMLFDVTPLSADARVPLTLTFDDGHSLRLSLPVREVMGHSAPSRGH
ncbi:copper chaperone PCu(A)C [Aeromonas simiae]|uniref:copper chaperone PCu(A)C n=1 Tax=Aeromonas simiae TaxID=218936 RepID=UPI00266D5176|nr:copper chaperone PCu(A)C [Aeromonas simiae]MDO2948148.1 copper chaperone PCu(A)C [Aeromonas simiae]MDO2953808.1 copper chaperone PCu(A)C [Aeromonas simiae]MDO2955433.1 copper chaperone PCu(A)C [Aeromonas simiae]